MNVETKEVVAMEVTTDVTHDSKVFPKLLEEAERHGRVVKVYGDGAYDSSEIYELLESKGVEAAIKPRKNSRSETPSEARGRAVSLYRRLGHQAWAKLKRYGRRWSVETAYSTFKRTFGEFCMAKTLKNTAKELTTKAIQDGVSREGVPIVLTADRTLMSEYGGGIFLGFSACVPKGLIPDRLYFSLFCPQ